MIDKKPLVTNNAQVNKLVMQSVIKQTTSQYRLDNDDDEIPSYDSHKDSYNNIDRLMHTISHVKIDGPDVVVYQNNVNNSFLNGLSNADITVNTEVFRIPKSEVMQLLQDLYSK